MTDSFGRVATVTSTGIATPAYIPPSITSVTASNITTNSMKVTVVASDGQNTIKGYKFSTDGGSTYGSLVSTTSHNYEYTLNGLTDNTTYPIRVKAVDTIDRESSAGSTSATTLYIEPTVTCSTSGITWGSITVNASATAGSTSISTYNFKKGSEGWVGTQAGSSYTFTSLDPSTQYSFTVEVTDAGGHTATASCSGTTSSYTYPVVNSVTTSGVTYDSGSFIVSATGGTGTISTYEYMNPNATTPTWRSMGSSNTLTFSGNLTPNRIYRYQFRVKDSNNMYSEPVEQTLTTSKVDASLVNYTNTDYTYCTNL